MFQSLNQPSTNPEEMEIESCFSTIGLGKKNQTRHFSFGTALSS